MKKLPLFLCTAVISYYGGVALAETLFGPITGTDEIVTACILDVAALCWFLWQVFKRCALQRAAVRSAARIAKYEAWRDKRFREIDDNNYLVKYQVYRQYFFEGRGR